MVIAVDTGNKQIKIRREEEPVSFRYGGRKYLICYRDVVSYIHAYAAAVMYSKDMKLRQLAKVLIVDIGGFTLDYLLLLYGEAGYRDICLFGKRGYTFVQ